ncbi:hypothetical protein GCM10010214_16970 [Streptomyces abikoensis]|nr:hypothetical protein GCM10010214_16970 [Streptomyces abikoensis]
MDDDRIARGTCDGPTDQVRPAGTREGRVRDFAAPKVGSYAEKPVLGEAAWG